MACKVEHNTPPHCGNLSDWSSALFAQAQEFENFMKSGSPTATDSKTDRADVMKQLYEHFMGGAQQASTSSESTSTSSTSERRVAHGDVLKNLFEAFVGPLETQKENKDGVALKKESFEVTVDCDGYEPCELTVKVADGFVTISGKHENKFEDGSNYVSRQFTRKHLLPKNVNIDAISSAFSDRKVLRIEAPLILESPKETAIPISVVRGEAPESKEPTLD